MCILRKWDMGNNTLGMLTEDCIAADCAIWVTLGFFARNGEIVQAVSARWLVSNNLGPPKDA